MSYRAGISIKLSESLQRHFGGKMCYVVKFIRKRKERKRKLSHKATTFCHKITMVYVSFVLIYQYVALGNVKL